MVTILYVVASVLMVLGVFMMLRLTPVQITQDMMDLMRPANKIRTLAGDIQAKRRRGGAFGLLQRIRNTMEATGRAKAFPVAITAVLGLAALGVFVSILIKNLWLLPALAIGFGALPILYLSSAVEYYEKTVRDELETALSIITNAYIRTDDIVVAVRENLDFIKPPLRGAFEKFLQDSAVMPSNKEIIIRLRDRLDDHVFYEWCTTLLQCQDDRTLKENLNPVVGKLTDIRLVNTQNAAVVATAKTEYYSMAAFVIASVPLLEVLSPGSLEMLMTSGIGKFLVGIVVDVVLFTFFRLRRATRMVDFNTK